MYEVMQLPDGWRLQADDEARPALVHTDGRRVEPRQIADMECAENVYIALKLEHDRLQREHAGVEVTAKAMAIWSAYAVIGYFRRQKRKELRLLKEKQKPTKEFEIGDEGEVYDLKGNPVGMTLPPLEEDEDPEDFLDKELDGLARAQQLSRAKLWTPGVN